MPDKIYLVSYSIRSFGESGITRGLGEGMPNGKGLCYGCNREGAIR